MPNKTLRGNVDILIAKEGYALNPLAPTAAELNATSFVTNISCAVNDEFNINLVDPDTDSTMSVCDTAEVETPTFANYEVSFNVFRDADPTAIAGVYNKALALIAHPGITQYVIVRIGKAQGSTFATGDIVSIFGVKTDYAVDVTDPGAPMQVGARYKPIGSFVVEKVI